MKQCLVSLKGSEYLLYFRKDCLVIIENTAFSIHKSSALVADAGEVKVIHHFTALVSFVFCLQNYLPTRWQTSLTTHLCFLVSYFLSAHGSFLYLAILILYTMCNNILILCLHNHYCLRQQIICNNYQRILFSS